MSADMFKKKYSGWTWCNEECDVAIATSHLMCSDEIAYLTKSITLAIKLKVRKGEVKK